MLGYLDDLIIVPAGIALVLRLIPPEVMADARRRAWSPEAERVLGRRGAAAIIGWWAFALAVALGLVVRILG